VRALVVGSTNIDLVLEVDAIPLPGETVQARHAHRMPGGKGANQAVALARLGAEVRFVSAVGDDWSLGELVREGVDVGGVLRADVETGTAVVLLDGRGENSIVVSAGANALVAAPPDVTADVVLLSLEVPLVTVVETARRATCPVVLNPSPWQPLPPELLAAVDVIVVNETEAAALGDVAPHVVVTLGARGATVDGRPVPAHPVEAVDTTGAGDCFAAALALGVGAGKPLLEAAELACAAAALSVRHVGARTGYPTYTEVSAQLER
jgi:ribokinase